jgi:hypothetical protein
VGEQLAVDVELAHAARDQLRELAPEVEDDDRVGLGGNLRGSLRGRRVQRLLQIGLDLRVIRGEDSMAGVRGLAMNGPPPSRWR